MMDPMELDENGHLKNEISVDLLLPPDDSATCDLLRGQDISPRIGADYQVEIPEPVQRTKYLLLSKNVENSENVAMEYLVGLPIPVLLISQEHENTKVEKIKAHQSLNPSRKGRGESGSLNADPENVGLPDEPVIKPDYSDYSFVPLSETGCWTDMEMSSFLLGLYIFEKNFFQIKRFVQTKTLGEIMSFYYGKFYRSHEYHRWSDSRKMKSRKCVFGQKIFTGLRQQEFLSRLSSNVSDDCKNALLEVSKTFGEGKVTLEEYVFSLKAMVGMGMLVEAMGIGKGKQDLTGMALEPSRSNHPNQLRPEIPIGKACQYLTPSEIVKFLTGDYRLSKARSNDLFWEAVWPRLLARGWHSEEPKDLSYAASSKNPLVFLVPGVKKFSRRRLDKGNDYFDSISDVLNKVALEPSLIELDTENTESKRNQEELEAKNNAVSEEDDVPTRKRRFYLQLPSRGTESMKFTILDSDDIVDGTSYTLCDFGIVMHEYLSKKAKPGNLFKHSDTHTPEISTESDDLDAPIANKLEINISNVSDNLLNGDLLSGRKRLQSSASKRENDSSYPVSETRPVNDYRGKFSSEDKRSKKEVKKRQSTQRTKDDNVQNIGPVNKRSRRLTVCNQLEPGNITLSSSIVPALEAQLPTQSMDLSSSDENICPLASSPEKLYVNTESKGYLGDDNVACDNVICMVSIPQESSQNQTLIDLNIPPLDFENDVLMEDAAGSNNDKVINPTGDSAPQPATDVVSFEQLPNMNHQRRGTRNRPPTSRALEALANGLLTVNTRRKDKEAGSRSRRPPRHSQHARGNTPGLIVQSPHQPNSETSEFRTELSATYISSAPEESQNFAGTNADQVPFSHFEVVSPDNRVPPASGN